MEKRINGLITRNEFLEKQILNAKVQIGKNEEDWKTNTNKWVEYTDKKDIEIDNLKQKLWKKENTIRILRREIEFEQSKSITAPLNSMEWNNDK